MIPISVDSHIKFGENGNTVRKCASVRMIFRQQKLKRKRNVSQLSVEQLAIRIAQIRTGHGRC